MDKCKYIEKAVDQLFKRTSMKIKIQKSKIKYNYNNRRGKILRYKI